ncbi:hypothetical protein Pcinc_002131 [Petrolisthes cinctipes]|uniref:Reverse transcriptase/retrotransposon-derived protein RNase H-like domain-containing protein n=1 Tax=Petrolisthes cinctipes TaxID=88211 RepID=A0AAE1L3B4_PETCI|nr:hypothetical protein Pcinc_002131 [Petrolisthes cinctipes]
MPDKSLPFLQFLPPETPLDTLAGTADRVVSSLNQAPAAVDAVSSTEFLSNQDCPLARSNSARKHVSALTLKAANATTIKTHGSTTLSVSLGLRRKFNWSYILADVENSIIGCDFLSHFDLSVRPRCRQIVDNSTNLTMQGEILAPVHSLLVEKRRGIKDTVKWTPSAEEAFNLAKTALASATSLHHPDPTAQMGLFTDASSTSMGAVLQQWHNDPEFNQLAETSLKIVRQPVRDHDYLELICDDSTGTVRPVVPKDMRKSVFLVLHNMSHPGRKATFKLISRRYLNCNKVRWIPLHLSRRYIVPVLVESASHQFDSSRNLGEGPVAVHAASVNY